MKNTLPERTLPPVRSDLSQEEIFCILRDEGPLKIAVEHYPAWLVEGILSDRCLLQHVDTAKPFTGAMITRAVPVSVRTGEVGRSIAYFARKGVIHRVGAVFRDYPRKTGQPVVLWQASEAAQAWLAENWYSNR